MYLINHPSYVRDLKSKKIAKKDLIAYLGSEDKLEKAKKQGLVTYANDSTKNKSTNKKSKSKSHKSSSGDNE